MTTFGFHSNWIITLCYRWEDDGATPRDVGQGRGQSEQDVPVSRPQETKYGSPLILLVS
jgi:hypothetical protein